MFLGILGELLYSPHLRSFVLISYGYDADLSLALSSPFPLIYVPPLNLFLVNSANLVHLPDTRPNLVVTRLPF